jgi:aspartyl-tRNA(Asn)/glutamyl-tRNA(Gln) amidotransferase subunit A
MRRPIVTASGADLFHKADVVHLAARFAAGMATPQQVTESYVARIRRLNPRINAFVYADADAALRDAAASGARWAAGAPLSPIDGTPIGVKANIAVRGMPWHAGVRAYRDRIADEDADVIQALRGAGAVILGVLNMHEAALGATNDNPTFGRCHNPYRHDFTPGGSSGGSAAAVAAGLCAAALGTDTMGSVRIPAGFCGVFGHLPARGGLSTRGVVPLSRTLDRVGVLARSVGDAGALAEAMRWTERPPDQARPIRAVAAVDLSGQVRLGGDVREAFELVQRRAHVVGLSVERVSLDGYDVVRLQRACLLIAEVEALCEYGPILDADPSGLSPELHGMLSWARRQPASKLDDAYALLSECAAALERQLSGFDAVLTPTTGTPAFAFREPAPNALAAFTLLGNILGWAATAFPVGAGADGLPLSAQILCRDDVQALNWAGRLALPGPGPTCFDSAPEVARAIR